MAALLLAMLPILILYLFLQRYSPSEGARTSRRSQLIERYGIRNHN